MKAVTVTCRAACSTETTNTDEFRRCDGLSSALFKTVAIESDTVVTNSQTPRPGGEVINLIVTVPTKRTLKGVTLLWLMVFPHRFLPLETIPKRGLTVVILDC
jgi:hypothetical protein